MTLSANTSKHNFWAFLWHAGFLAFAQNFMDVDTVIPAMVVEAGGSALHVGIMTSIMMGGASFSQLLFAPLVSNVAFKKKYLLTGINLRIISLFALAMILYRLSLNHSSSILVFIFIFISLFSFSGAFTNISYVDIIGKSISSPKRKTFFSAKQILGGLIVVSTAFLAKKILSAYNYPVNFSVMFLIGAFSLLVASGGFWKIRETEASGLQKSGAGNFLKNMASEWKSNPKLKYFLGFINTQGIAMSILPFVILYAKETFHSGSAQTGLFLLFKVIGVVSVSLLVLIITKKMKYNTMLFANVLLSVIFSLSVLLVKDLMMFKYLFILGGMIVSLYVITMNGILLEISGTHNRALYAGFAGAGSLLPTLFPLISGSIIKHWGFPSFFIAFMLIVSLSVFFIHKINCTK
ncbi:MAG: MFS transporter [Prolixibacteraceae bacterium]